MVLPIIIFILPSCSNNGEDNVVLDLTTSIGSGISAIGGILDEQANNNSYLIETCSGRTVLEVCSSGEKLKTYDNCTITVQNPQTELNTNLTLNGNITLTYSDSNCDLSTTDDTVIKTYNFSRDTILGGTQTINSELHRNYEGVAIEGGGKLSKTDSGWNLKILGKHKKITNKEGQEILDLSIYTTDPISITGALYRDARIINSGLLKIYNNKLAYQVSLVPIKLTYEDSCCYPLNGSISITYLGSINGTGTVTFNNLCGHATLTYENQSNDLIFNSCE